jgi:hypothetical protein
MASVLNQLPTSTLSLQGNGFNPQLNNPAWGFADATANLDPEASRLQRTYSVDSVPQVRLINFERNGRTTVRPEAQLDELDRRAPNLRITGVVSQIYKSKAGRKYSDLGPSTGQY